MKRKVKHQPNNIKRPFIAALIILFGLPLAIVLVAQSKDWFIYAQKFIKQNKSVLNTSFLETRPKSHPTKKSSPPPTYAYSRAASNQCPPGHDYFDSQRFTACVPISLPIYSYVSNDEYDYVMFGDPGNYENGKYVKGDELLAFGVNANDGQEWHFSCVKENKSVSKGLEKISYEVREGIYPKEELRGEVEPECGELIQLYLQLIKPNSNLNGSVKYEGTNINQTTFKEVVDAFHLK
jgi:hypothetical protein